MAKSFGVRPQHSSIRFLMGKRKRKLTAAEKAEKRRRREMYHFVFVGGRMKRVRRPPMIDGMDADEFIRRNADPIWLHQNEMWESIEVDGAEFLDDEAHPEDRSSGSGDVLAWDDDLPF
jgi:hypothetical protein